MENRKKEEENRKRAEENRKREEENRKRAEENRKRAEENRKREETKYCQKEESWKTHRQTLESEIRYLRGVCGQQQQELKNLNGSVSKHVADNKRLSSELVSKQQQYTEYHAAVSAEIEKLKQQNQDFQAHIGRMSQIISQLNKGGLPETNDDRYYMDKLDDLVESISQWARLFSRGQPLLTVEYLKNTRVTERVRNYLISAFLDIRSLLDAKNVGGKVRTRFVEAIMLRTLMGDRLWKRHIGFPECDYESHSNLIQKMSSTGKSHCSNYL